MSSSNFLLKIFNSLYWRLSFLLLLIVLVVGSVYTYITADATDMYFIERNQRLNQMLAENIVKYVFEENTDSIQQADSSKRKLSSLMMDLMALNPGIEVYILDNSGKVLSAAHGEEKIKRRQISTAILDSFIDKRWEHCVAAEDPRTQQGKITFSAAKFKNNGQEGYVYTVLNSEKYESVVQALSANYRLKLAYRSMGMTLITTLFLGILSIWYLTRNLRRVIQTVNKFEQGDLNARIPIKSRSELNNLSATFNNMAETIVQNIEDLKSTEQFRKELIANVSHDLRTPLAVIHGYVETLMIKKDTISNEERHKYTQIILKSTDKLRKLVTELFEFSQFEAEQIKTNKEPFFVNELVQDISQQYRLLLEEKNIHLSSNFSHEQPMVEADVALIERVFQNLLDNAIKFTPENGQINIQIKKLNQESLKVVISDSGIGIPANEIEDIFDRYTTQSRYQENEQGVGLGLSIVKKILELHESSFTINSQEGQGTTFTFCLPIYNN